jgi:hypothetical protein
MLRINLDGHVNKPVLLQKLTEEVDKCDFQRKASMRSGLSRN